ncbi:MAG: o-succinylbenzoate synthase, partial [Deltaproteobacteria bacterium]|nr:o-succinylbenzoate synthase [Deltaproteobacteria bacterium]
MSDARSTRRRARPVLAAPIVAIDVQRRELALRKPLVTAQDTMTVRTVFLVTVRDADGVVGLGEAAPLVWAGTETEEQCLAALESLRAGVLRGGDADAALHDCPAASAAWDLALHDLAACRLAVPLARLLGDSTVPDVAVNALVADAAGASAAVDQGFETLKVKVGRSLDADVIRLRAIREAVGPAPALRIDPNGAWVSVSQALRALEQLAPYALEYVEQPIAAGEIGTTARALAEVRERSGVAVAPDESVTGVEEARLLLATGAAD